MKLCSTAVKRQQCLYHFRLLSVIYEVNWNKNGLPDKCFSFWNGATHHSDALQSVVFVWDLNCMLHIPEYDDTGFNP